MKKNTLLTLFFFVLLSWTQSLPAQCLLNALVSTSSSTPNTISFWTTVNSNAYSEQWLFGDGSVSSQSNPTHTYANSGTYYYTLYVQDSLGCTDTVYQSVTISTQTGCQLQALARDSLIGGYTIAFMATAQGQNNYAYRWDFGDGRSASQANPIHTYTSSGTYAYTLYVRDSLGCADTVRQSITIAPQSNCNINASAWDSLISNYTIAFGVQIPVQGNYTYRWDFGDGTHSLQANTSHTYANTGTYTYMLRIWNNSLGCIDTISQTITIYNRCNLHVSDSLISGNTIDFTISGQGQGYYNYYWDFGNSTGVNNYLNPAHPIFTYAHAGTYSYTFYVWGPQGCADTISQTVTVNVPNGCPSFFASDSLVSPSTVAFSSHVSTGNYHYGQYFYIWRFDDGSISLQANPTHTFAHSGTHSYSLCLQDSFGCVDTVYQTVSLPVQTICQLNIAIGDSLISRKVVAFKGLGLGLGYYAYRWNFGDGLSSSNASPRHTYARPGTYYCTLYIQDSFGCADTINKTITIAPQSHCNLNASAWSSLSGRNTMTFGATIPVQGNYAYRWNFGDGTQSSQRNTTHTYPSSGTYVYMLRIWNHSLDCVDTISQSLTISAQNSCNIQASTSLIMGNTIAFRTSGQGQGYYNYLWDFGDGSVFTRARTPTHTYAHAGTYSYTLYVWGSLGCADTISQTVTVNVPNGCPTVTVNSSLINRNTVAFSSHLSAGNYHYGQYFYQWYFGDGGQSTLANPTHTYSHSGTHSYSLYLQDSFGCADTVYQTVSLPVQTICQLNIAIGDSLISRKVVAFKGLGLGLGYYAYRWDFGDGLSSSNARPRHTYARPGTYYCTLYIQDSFGCADTINKTITIASQSHCNLNASAWSSLSGRNTMTFGATIPVQGNYAYRWNFGDGTQSSQRNTTHTYPSSGTYVYMLRIWNHSLDCVDTISQSLTISAQNSCNIQASDSLVMGNTIAFRASGQGQGYYNYRWDFGDGSVFSGSRKPTHTYAHAGTYSYTLYVWGPQGCADTISQTVTVNVPNGCPTVTVNSSLINRNTVAFSSHLSVGNYHYGQYFYQWHFGDGGQTTLANPTHTYSTPNTYSYSLYLQDSFGCVDTVYQTVSLATQSGCQLHTSVRDTLINRNTVAFEAQGQGAGYFSYYWDFGDGRYSSYARPRHTYTHSGIYYYTLYLQDSFGCADTVYQSVTIPCLTNAVNLTLNFDSYPQETSWDITNSSGTVLYSGNNYANNNQNISESFCLPMGCYNFNIYDSYGDGICCLYGQGSYTLTNSVGSVLATGGSFAYQETSTICVGGAVNPCAGAVASFSSTTNGNTVVFSATSNTANYYNWTFGDGSTGSGSQVSHTYQASPANNYYIVCVDALDSAGCTVTYCDSIMILPASCSNDIVTLTLNLDNFPSETSWEVVDATGAVLYNGNNYTTSGARVIENFCLVTGCYDFNIYDSYGDGICCQSGLGNFVLTDTAGVILASGAAFGSSQTSNICVGGATNPCSNFSTSFTHTTSPTGTASFVSSVVGGAAPYSYQWSFNNSSSILANPSYNYGGNGGYSTTLIVTDANGCLATYTSTIMITNVNTNPCGSATMNLNITQNPLNDFILNARPVINNSPQNSSYGFSWDFGDSTIIGGFSSHQYTNWGTYILCVVATDTINGCAVVACDTITIDSAGNFSRSQGYKDIKAGFVINTYAPIINLITGVAKEEKVSKISLSPNPSSTTVTVNIESTTNEEVQLTVLNMQGKVIYSQSHTIQNGVNLMPISVYDFPSGAYLLRATSHKIQQTLMFVKK